MNRGNTISITVAAQVGSIGMSNAKAFSRHRLLLPVSQPSTLNPPPSTRKVSLLTAGRDRPYALGLAAALAGAGVNFDFIGSNEVDAPELHNSPQIHFLNLRGDQSVEAGLLRKISRVLVYYVRLLAYAVSAKPKVFHILWNNKFEFFDRVILMLYYKLAWKKNRAHRAQRQQRRARWDGFLVEPLDVEIPVSDVRPHFCPH